MILGYHSELQKPQDLHHLTVINLLVYPQLEFVQSRLRDLKRTSLFSMFRKLDEKAKCRVALSTKLSFIFLNSQTVSNPRRALPYNDCR